MLVYVLNKTLAIFETQFIKKLSNTGTQLKTGVPYKNIFLYYSIASVHILH